MPNLRKNPVAAWQIAVVHEGQHLPIRQFQKAPAKRHDGVEHSQRRNYTSRQRGDRKAIRDTKRM